MTTALGQQTNIQPTVCQFPYIPAVAPPRGSTGGATILGMTLDQLRWVIQSIISKRLPAAPQEVVTQTRGCDNNKRYKDLDPLKFEGDRKEYMAFRQSKWTKWTSRPGKTYVYKFLKEPVREK